MGGTSGDVPPWEELTWQGDPEFQATAGLSFVPASTTPQLQGVPPPLLPPLPAPSQGSPPIYPSHTLFILWGLQSPHFSL